MMRFMLAPQKGLTTRLSADPAHADLLSVITSRAFARETPSVKNISAGIYWRKHHVSYSGMPEISNKALLKRITII
jgi:hypothetical protein